VTFKVSVRTHDRWLTIMGAALVFAIFIVKDGYRVLTSLRHNSFFQSRAHREKILDDHSREFARGGQEGDTRGVSFVP